MRQRNRQLEQDTRELADVVAHRDDRDVLKDDSERQAIMTSAMISQP
jgi:hypothetical protein